VIAVNSVIRPYAELDFSNGRFTTLKLISCNIERIPVKIRANSMQRLFISSLTLFLLALSAWAEENTAYNALRLVGTLRGEQTLQRVLGVFGESGKPQPNRWVIVLDDPAARGGVRELEIVSNQVASERTPVGSEFAGGKTIDLNQLNLDSDGAYQVAEGEAKKNGASFDKVDYRLSADSSAGKPLWVVNLRDSQRQDTGIVKVAADTGALVSSGNWANGSSGGLASQDVAPNSDQELLNQNSEPDDQPTTSRHPAYSRSVPNYARGDVSDQGESVSSRALHYGQAVGNTVERAFRKAGGWIQKKVTGRDTISLPPRNSDEDDDDNQDQYSQPVQPQQVPE
jgi:hypothetical protein